MSSPDESSVTFEIFDDFGRYRENESLEARKTNKKGVERQMLMSSFKPVDEGVCFGEPASLVWMEKSRTPSI